MEFKTTFLQHQSPSELPGPALLEKYALNLVLSIFNELFYIFWLQITNSFSLNHLYCCVSSYISISCSCVNLLVGRLHQNYV